MNRKLLKSSPAVALFCVITLLIGRGRCEPPTTAPTTAPTTNPANTWPAISIETHFSAEEEIAPTIVKLIDDAQHSLDIAAFAFTHPEISAAIIRAHQRGVRVRFVMDYTQSRSKICRAADLIAAGIDARTRHRRGFQHNKYIVIDQLIVLTGSYNFTESADARNTENLLIIRDAPKVVHGFSRDFQRLYTDSLRKR